MSTNRMPLITEYSAVVKIWSFGLGNKGTLDVCPGTASLPSAGTTMGRVVFSHLLYYIECNTGNGLEFV